jgi:cytosine/adenosine deaminase-related metal-dependent hydrolase
MWGAPERMKPFGAHTFLYPYGSETIAECGEYLKIEQTWIQHHVAEQACRQSVSKIYVQNKFSNI